MFNHDAFLFFFFPKNMFLSVAQAAEPLLRALILLAAAATGGENTLWRSRGQCADSRAEKARMQDCVGFCRILTQLWKHTVIGSYCIVLMFGIIVLSLLILLNYYSWLRMCYLLFLVRWWIVPTCNVGLFWGKRFGGATRWTKTKNQTINQRQNQL